MRTGERAAVLVTLTALVLGACAGTGDSDRTAAPEPSGSGCPDLPASAKGKSANPVKDPGFWTLIRHSCEVSNDGDELQAAALQDELRELEPAQVKQFQVELRKANRALDTEAFMRAAAHVCRIDVLGLGDDLGMDYRSWMVAHGRAAYEAVLADPAALADLPDAELGCGMGEYMTDAAIEVYDELRGQKP